MRGFVKCLHTYITKLKIEQPCYALNKIKIFKYFLKHGMHLGKTAIRLIIYLHTFETKLDYNLKTANVTGNEFF
jgi:hypothetical protein